MSLIEALNGPCSPRQPPSAMPDLVETPENEHSVQAAQILNRQCDRSTPTKSRSKSELSSPDYDDSTLMEHKHQENGRESQKLLSTEKGSSRAKHRQKDSIKVVNEKIELNEVSIKKILVVSLFKEKENNQSLLVVYCYSIIISYYSSLFHCLLNIQLMAVKKCRVLRVFKMEILFFKDFLGYFK